MLIFCHYDAVNIDQDSDVHEHFGHISQGVVPNKLTDLLTFATDCNGTFSSQNVQVR